MAGRIGPSHRGPREAGFTLLELLVAFTLLAMLLALLAGGLRFGATAWQKGVGKIDAVTEVGLVQQLVRRLLSEALPLRPFVEQDPPSIAFSGDGDRVTFLGFASAQAIPGGVYQIGLAIEGDRGDRNLVMSWRRLVFEGRDFAPWDENQRSVLMAGIDSGAFAYFGPDGADRANPSWRDSWKDLSALPVRVRLRLVFPAGDMRNWPTLVVAPRVGEGSARRE